MKKTKEMLNEKMQVKLPENLSTENIMSNIDNSKAEIIEMPKKKNIAKKIVPLVASLFLVIGIVGVYLSSQQKNAPDVSNHENAEVIRYQSYDEIYEKIDAIKKVSKNESHSLFFNYAQNNVIADDMMTDGAIPESAPGAGSSSTIGAVVEEDTATNINGSTSTNKNFGTTNTQEKDVDEGDIIKTDGNYLYIANGESNMISIVDVTGEKMTVCSEISIDRCTYINEIYIQGNKMAVVGFVDELGYYDVENWPEYDEEEDVVYFNPPFKMKGTSFVKVYDVSNRKKPKLVNEYYQQGNYHSSRMIGTKLYVISEYYFNIFSDNYRIECIPKMVVNEACNEIPAECISIIEDSVSTTYAVITTLDLSKDAEPECEAILGECNHLYASSKGLFLCEVTGEEMENITKIYKFDYTDTGVEYKCTGKVNGYINNQFSMSYDGEYFRIATTQNNTKVDGEVVSFSIDDRTNNLYILNNDMEIVGKVEDLAKGESIKSVRFVGNMAYVVTFRQTDPLFVIDLSNPEKPTVKGELKIPGFSEYLHPITQNLIVGVGQDGTETGTNGDCKVSLFDVTDPYAPKETVSLPVTGGSCHVYTGVSYNHKLFITLSDTEFAVPFNLDWYVKMNGIEKGGNFYIRYKLQNGTLCETERYFISDEKCEISGATYVENTFYVVNHNYSKQSTEIVAFDLTTHKEIDRITTYEK